MENTQTPVDPKDDRITNQDNSVTNHDAETDNPKSSEPVVQDQPDEERVKTVTPNEDIDPGAPDDIETVDSEENDDESAGNKDGGPSQENL